MKISAVKYMRDFYPEEMRLRLWIEDAWRRVSERAGFEPWDAPILEHLDLYTRKSGEEIVGQLYTLTDQGDRRLAIRPEMTPSLARMISARQAALPRPIKWYTIGRMCRYERGQRGRLREFWQWNIDVLGVAGPAADAEVVSVAIDGLEECGLASDDVEVRINSRKLFASILAAIGVDADRQAAVYAVTDKRGKVPPEALAQMYADLKLGDRPAALLEELLAATSLADVASFCSRHKLDAAAEPLRALEELFAFLQALGKSAYCRFDIGVVRGLAYYTGPVFEIFDRGAKLRAICGGGRYDNLLELMGGQAMPACGFGLGDVVLSELLKEKNRLPTLGPAVEVQVIALEEDLVNEAMKVAARLRAKGRRCDYVMKPGPLGKALKRAGESGVLEVVLIGRDELAAGVVKIRDMSSGQERSVARDGL